MRADRFSFPGFFFVRPLFGFCMFATSLDPRAKSYVVGANELSIDRQSDHFSREITRFIHESQARNARNQRGPIKIVGKIDTKPRRSVWRSSFSAHSTMAQAMAMPVLGATAVASRVSVRAKTSFRGARISGVKPVAPRPAAVQTRASVSSVEHTDDLQLGQVRALT